MDEFKRKPSQPLPNRSAADRLSDRHTESQKRSDQPPARLTANRNKETPARSRSDRLTNPLARIREREKQTTNVQKVVHRIEIKFLFPQFAKDSFRRVAKKIHPKQILRKIGTKRIAIVLVIIIGTGIGYTMYQQLLNRPIEVTQDLGNGVKKSKIVDKPNYNTVLPASKSIDQLGGWTRVSPPDRNPVFAYTDTIGKASINVSQQPIPKDAARSNDDFVATLAKSYLANDKVAAGDTTFYVGTSAKGPQSVIFGKGDTLVLIRSSVKIEDTQWAKYISSLK